MTNVSKLVPSCRTWCANLIQLRQFLTGEPSTVWTVARFSRHSKTARVSSHQIKSWSYTHGESSIPLLGATIGQLMEQAAEHHPDREAFIFPHQGIKMTSQQLLQQCDQLAAGLSSLGVEKGDRVGIWAPNCAEWILAQYATARAGFILVNINPAYQSSELNFCLRKVGIKVLIMAQKFKTQNYFEILHHICPELVGSGDRARPLNSEKLPDLKWVVMIGKDRIPGTLLFSDLMAMGNSELQRSIHDLQKKLQFDDPINIQFTSGTTGQPKGASLTHHNIVNNARLVGFRMSYHLQDTRICLPVPLYHCFGMVLGSLQSVVHSATVVLPSMSFDPQATLAAVDQEKCTSLYGTPTMFIDILNSPDFSDFNLSSLYTGIMAGAICPMELIKGVISKLHMKDISNCYGTTETSPVTFQTLSDDPLVKRTSTVGKVHPHCEAKIVDEEGNIVPIGVSGELLIRGYSVMRGYWDDQVQTAKTITDDKWYHTGDIAVFDKDGYATVVGRKKDLIIRGGENIYPAEIEQFLYTHPNVADVQVIGVPDERLGEQVAAWIRLRDQNEAVTAQEIKEFCKGNIAHYKIPYYISFVKEYPLTITGKVQKFKMREMALKMYGLKHTTKKHH